LNLGEIETKVRQQVRDTGTGTSLQRYSDTVLDGFINEGMRDVVNQTGCLDQIYNITLVANTTFYALPSDFIAIQFARFKDVSNNTYNLEEKNERSFRQSNPDWQRQTGKPVNYFTRTSTSAETNELALYPIPSTATHLGTIIVDYVSQTSDMVSDSDEPFDGLDSMNPYHNVLVDYATARIKLIEGRTDEGNAYGQLYISGITTIAAKFGQKPNWSPSFSGATK